MQQSNSTYADLAVELYNQGYNCSQSVFAAFCDVTGLELETALKLSSSFGGGMGRLREVCGAVSGAFMVLGLLYGQTDPADKEAKGAHYQRIHDLGMQFRAQQGSYLCRDLLQLTEEEIGLTPIDQSAKERVKLFCPELVRLAATLVTDYMAQQQAGSAD